MKRIFAVWLFLCLSNVFAESGKIKICRMSGSTDPLGANDIVVPSGSLLTSAEEDSDLIVATEKDALLRLENGCATVTANLMDAPLQKVLPKKADRLIPQFATPGVSLRTIVIEDFK